MGALEPGHLVVVLVIVLIIFGPGKLPQLGKSIGEGIREFKRSTEDGSGAGQTARAPAEIPAASAGQFCRNCGAPVGAEQKFCGSCGAARAPAAAATTAGTETGADHRSG